MKFELDRYFERIGWRPGGESPLEQLKTVHMRHLMSIPFENLDVYLKKPISLDPDDIYEKLVLRRRGGYCFEMNLLMHRVVSAMGFDVQLRLARVYNPEQGFMSLSHCMNIVTLDGNRYLLDVGYGGNCFFAPVLLEEGTVQEQKFNTYRVLRSDVLDFVVQCMEDGEFINMLGFDDKPPFPVDLDLGNYYASTSPKAAFTGNIMCARILDGKKYTLLNDRLSIRNNGELHRQTVERAALPGVLKEYFGIEVDGL